jgi:hypothetical protein
MFTASPARICGVLPADSPALPVDVVRCALWQPSAHTRTWTLSDRRHALGKYILKSPHPDYATSGCHQDPRRTYWSICMHSTVLICASSRSPPRVTSGSTKILYYSKLKAGSDVRAMPGMVARLRVESSLSFCLNGPSRCRSATHPPQPPGCSFSGSFACFLISSLFHFVSKKQDASGWDSKSCRLLENLCAMHIFSPAPGQHGRTTVCGVQ